MRTTMIAVGLLIARAALASDIPCPFGIPSHQGERLAAPLPRGAELFSWRSDGGFRYALLARSSERRSEREIQLRACTLQDRAALEAELGKLAPGEKVSWTARPRLERPGAGEVEAIRGRCQTLGIALEILPASPPLR